MIYNASKRSKVDNIQKKYPNAIICDVTSTSDNSDTVSLSVPSLRHTQRNSIIHAKHKTGLDRKQRENHTRYDVKVKNILGKESLEPSEVGIPVDSRRHRVCQFVEADRLHHTECVEQQRHKFYACQIHTLSKVLLHNREDLVNFCKFNQLRIKCLTA